LLVGPTYTTQKMSKCSIVLLALIGLVACSHAFQTASILQHQHSRNLGVSCFAEKKLSYAEQLKLAKEAKAKGQTYGEVAPKRALSPAQELQFKKLTGAADADDDLPFTDEIYEDMAFILSKLEARCRKGTLLKPREVPLFSAAVGRVVADMRSPQGRRPQLNTAAGGGRATTDSLDASNDELAGIREVPLRNADLDYAKRLDEAAAAATVTETIGGVKMEMQIRKDSQHYVEGMETMTPDEYRKAMDQKIRDVRTARRQAGYKYGGRQLDDYFSSLSKPRDSDEDEK